MRKVFLSLLFLLALGAFFPTLLSTTIGKKKVESYLEAHLGGAVSIDKLHLSWKKKQYCKKIQWKEEKVTCEIEEVAIEASFIDCLFYESRSFPFHISGGRITSPSKISILKKKKPIDLTFTPVTAQIDHGVVHFGSTEIQLNKKHTFLMEGKLDLLREHMDIQLGIPSSTLSSIFKLDRLPEDYLLSVPLSCKMTPKALEKKLLGVFLRNYAKVTSSQR